MTPDNSRYFRRHGDDQFPEFHRTSDVNWDEIATAERIHARVPLWLVFTVIGVVSAVLALLIKT